ncbi:glycosyl transferase [Lacrimispora amygdalina]|uniref:Glycosyl transferase n=2 Tax=Lacrimispora amygdalina TaxID=253257 RepID=A0ABQ5M0M7_9FIRM|nr:glycosyltransferase [Haloimpatiens lingqiaonensis]
MKVYLYSGMQKMIEKSGVGRAIYHQQFAAKQNKIGLAKGLEDAEIVHINTVFPKSLWLAMKAKKKGIPVIYHAHSTREDFRNSYIGSNLFAPIFGKWIKHCYNTGTMIVTPTEYSKRLLLSYGINKQIEAVSNGVDLVFYDKKNIDPMSFRKKYGYSAEQKVIMSVGLTIDRKGVSDFVELARRMPEYQFIWFGESNLNTVPMKTRRAVRTKLPNLRFAGYAKPRALRDAYGSCDLFLFPSKEETEGIVVLEALAMKIPVLLRKIPVYDDWLQENRDVYKADNIDDFESKTKKIVEQECMDLTEAGYQVVEERSIEKVGMRLGDIYKNCLENI